MKYLIKKLKGCYYNASIRSTLFTFSFLLFLFITLPSLLLLSYYQNRENESQIVDMLNTTLNTSSVNLQQTLLSAQRISSSVLASNVTQSFLKSNSRSSNDTYTVENAMYAICTSSAYKLSSYIFDTKGDCFYFDYTPKKELIAPLKKLPIIKQINRLDGKILCIDTNEIFKNETGISLMRVVKDMNSMKNIGYVIINIPADTLNNIFSSSDSTVYQSFILGRSGENLLHSSIPEDLLSDTSINASPTHTSISSFHNRNFIVGYKPLIDYDNYIIGFCYDTNYDNSHKIFLFNSKIAIILINIVILWIGIMLISRSVIKPVTSMSETMKNFTEKDFRKLGTNYTVNNELGYLVSCHNKMVDEIQQLLVKEVSIEKHRRHLELNLLQSQFKPHFLYNTIDQARSLCLSGEIKKANELMQAIGVYYKTVLSKGKTVITIADEINTICQYHSILSINEEVFYKINYIIDKRAQDMYILKFILQPLVENCIKHGLYGLDDGIITILFSLNNEDTLLISVSDNGKGMNPQLIDEIMKQSYHSSSKSFGLAATLERVRLYYGDDCTINIDSLSHGTAISFYIKNFSKYNEGTARGDSL